MNLKIFYVLENLQIEKKLSNDYGYGLVSPDYIRKIIPEKMDDLIIMCCGSKIMNNTFIKPMLLEMGYEEQNIFLFWINFTLEFTTIIINLN